MAGQKQPEHVESQPEQPGAYRGRRLNPRAAGIVLLMGVLVVAVFIWREGDEELVDAVPITEERVDQGRTSTNLPPARRDRDDVDRHDPEEVRRLQAELRAAERERLQAQRELEALQARDLALRAAESDEGRAGVEARMRASQRVLSRRSDAGQQQAEETGSSEVAALRAAAAVAESLRPAEAEPAPDPTRLELPPPQPSTFEAVSAVNVGGLDQKIKQGKFLRAVLETAINSSQPGFVRAVVAENVWSEDGSNVLIPKYSRLVGEYRATASQGENRVYVVWSRVAMPDGTDVALGSPTTDALGIGGLGGERESHFFRRFGGAVLFSVIGLAADAGDGDATVSVVGSDFQSAAAVALQNSINIPPTIHVDQGARVNVFVARDLAFGDAKRFVQR